MENITPEMQENARKELARRELARRELERRKTLTQPKEEETSIGEDIKQSFLNAPHAIGETLSSLPGEINAAAHMPLGRSLKNIGHGVENLATLPLDLGLQLVNYLAKKHVPLAEKIKEIYPSIPEHDLFGLGERQPGDVLWESVVPFGGLSKLTKGLTGLKGVASRAGGGALYSTAQGENPIESFLTGTALEGLTHGAVSTPRNIKNLGERIKAGASNAILRKAHKGRETGESFTPEQAATNALQQYTNIEGQPMGVDFGTLIGNKPLQDIYNVGSKIPFSEGRQQIAKLDKQLFDKKEELARLAHEKETGKLSESQKNYKDQLKTSIEALQKERDFMENELPKIDEQINEFETKFGQQEASVNQAPQVLSALKHPSVNHNILFKEDLATGFENSQNLADEAYKPFKELNVDLNSLRMPSEFKSQYREAYDELKKQSEDLKELFADDKDLGSDISREIKRADTFFEEKPAETKESITQTRIGNAPLFNLKTATPEAITTHIKNLQSLAEEAYASGKHREAALLNKMAKGMKRDMKKILSENGYTKAVGSLEEGDRIFRADVLPYYKNREIKKLVSDRTHNLTDTSRITLADLLHQPNMTSVLEKLSPEAVNASIYELITRGKYGPKGHNLQAKDIASLFNTHLKSNVRQSIANISPQLSSYLENLNPMIESSARARANITEMGRLRDRLAKNKTENISKQETQKEKAEAGHALTEEKMKESQANFNKAMKERLGIPKAKSNSIWATIRNLSPLNAAGLGTAIYAMGKVSVPHIAEALGLAVYPFKTANKILTEIENGSPKLLKHYIEGTKVKPEIKGKSALENRIYEGLSVPKNPPLSEKKKRKPLELELRSGKKY